MIKATLIRRYKRFLADVVLPDSQECTVHCPNPGAMTGLAESGMTVYLTPATNPKAKLPYRWVFVDTGAALVGVDTMRANRIMAEALTAKTLPEFASWPVIKPEVTVAAKTRLDFCLKRPADDSLYYLEVKSATLCTASGIASFPDSVTKRGQKHLQTLMDLVKQGHRSALVFVVQRNDCSQFALAGAIDPDYAALCHKARALGVEVQAWGCKIDPEQGNIHLEKRLEIQD